METESLSKRAHLVGMVQGAEWRWLFRNANVFALYSVYPEAGGNAYIEAQAAGLPIVTSDQGSLPLVVPHDEAGLIVPREPKETEIERLGQALRRVLEDEDLRKRLGEGGRKHASELTWRHCAEGYLKAMKYAMT
jgi:glycosyltransferase involved in cell wall biosynthesis